VITARYKPSIDRAFAPLVNALVRLRVSPAAVTLAGAALVLASCAWLLWSRNFLVFPWMVAAAGLAGALDGALARAAGRASRFGAYLDALCDRYVEVVVVMTVAWITGYWLSSMVMIVGSLLVSYAKARAAMEVPVDNREWPDLMERTERDVVYLIGLWLGQGFGWRVLGRDVFWWTLVVLNVLIHVTVVQRVLRARRLILERG
jgi:phosphatidylglycerophosphate synthase